MKYANAINKMSMAFNSFYGLLGFAVPSIAMLLAYPILIHRFGATKVGIYFLATSASGTLAFLDVGMSAATLKFVAEDVAKGEKRAAADTVVTSLLFYSVVGIVVGTAFWICSPLLVSLFSIRGSLQVSSLWLFRLGAVQFAVSFVSTVFLSLFKGVQRFDLSALVLSSLSLTTYGGAAIVALWNNSRIIDIMAVSLISNVLMLLISTVVGVKVCRSAGIQLIAGRFSVITLRRLFGFGSAMFVHNLTAIFFSQIQRLLVGALIGPAAVSAYVLATTVLAKAHQLISAATEIMFPVASSNSENMLLRRLYLRMLFGSAILSLLILIPLTVFSSPILDIWIGTSISDTASRLIPILVVGFFFMSISPAPFYMVNGLGRPWFNVTFDLLNVAVAVLAIGMLTLTNEITLNKFAWAFTVSNVITGLAFQTAVELLIWRKHLPFHKLLVQKLRQKRGDI
ncbi:oligosaccharide flippase family protein [Rubrobacter naiadicus]|uniref:oligosaccharide flippase family protein n=1 Tax=Rubrobacter naiadicus TaxID=1392641 RepID=UPI0023602B5C|nr:oligosaccharide flippase family protein [Rubrobacter naiadicus]